jgi:hypothetical protein
VGRGRRGSLGQDDPHLVCRPPPEPTRNTHFNEGRCIDWVNTNASVLVCSLRRALVQIVQSKRRSGTFLGALCQHFKFVCRIQRFSCESECWFFLSRVAAPPPSLLYNHGLWGHIPLFCTVGRRGPSLSSSSHSQAPSALSNPPFIFSPCEHERLSREGESGDNDRPGFQGQPSRLASGRAGCGPPLDVSVSMDPTKVSLESGWPIGRSTVLASRTKLTRWVESNGHGAARRRRLLFINDFTGDIGQGALANESLWPKVHHVSYTIQVLALYHSFYHG